MLISQKKLAGIYNVHDCILTTMVTTITAVLGDIKNTQAYTFYSWFAESHFKPCNNNMCAMQILYQNKLGCNHLYENLFGAEKCC